MLTGRHDPIVAVATAPGRGAVGIVRISGPQLTDFATQLCERSLSPRVATYLPLRDEQAQVIDRGLVLFFPAPHSYTGEDVLELQIHGGPVALQLLVARCLRLAQQATAEASALLPRLRLAQAGEFTQRAFLNGKLDLAQAEAVADLIDASTEAAARGASRSLSGEFSAQVHALRDSLIHQRMLTEANLDFPEEEIDVFPAPAIDSALSKLEQQLAEIERRARQGALLREGIKVVIAGQPNAGKSSLLNALAGAELAIVTPIAGTTRDKVQQTIQIQGVPLHVVDTAGLRDSQDEVERIGIARAWDEIRGADLILFLRDLTRQNDPLSQAADAAIAQRIQTQAPGLPVLTLWNKADVVQSEPPALRVEGVVHGNGEDAPKTLRLSAKTGLGLDGLRQTLLHHAGWQAVPDGVFLARARHLAALAQVGQHVQAARRLLQAAACPLDLLAEELRLAQNALNDITGEFTPDDLLGEIFSKFCIGK